jgi:hypothetical protein
MYCKFATLELNHISVQILVSLPVSFETWLHACRRRRRKAAFQNAAQDRTKTCERMAMPNVLSLLLLLLPALAACQTSRVQGFSVFRDQRESYILEAAPRRRGCPLWPMRQSRDPHILRSPSASYPAEFCACE